MSRNRVIAVGAILCVALLAFFLLRGGAQADAVAVDGAQKPEEAAATATSSGRSRPAASAGVAQAGKASETPTEQGRVYVQGAWGSGPDQFGRHNVPESNPEGPLTISVDSQGNTYVMDQVNGRILRFDKDGKPLEPFKVTQQAPHDVVPTSVGTTLVMDTTGDRTIAVLDKNGNLTGELPITGKHLPEDESGLASGVFADAEGVYVEREHAKTFRVGDAAGNPDPNRPLLDGRPSRDGTSLLSMGMVQALQGRFWVRSKDRQSGQLKFMREYTLPTPIMALVFLDSDPTGRIYAAARVGRELPINPADGGSGGGFGEQSLQLLCLDATGEPRKVLALPANTMAEESIRDLAVRDDGTILYMFRSEEGVKILQYSCS